jgi:hypothetical protein
MDNAAAREALIALRKEQGLGPDIHGEPYRKEYLATPAPLQVITTARKWRRAPAVPVDIEPRPDPTASLQTIREKLEEGAKDNGGPEGMEYGVPEKKIPEKFAAHMNEGETLASAQQRLLRDWWSELGRLRNLRGTIEENLEREQELEDLISVAAQLGELS